MRTWTAPLSIRHLRGVSLCLSFIGALSAQAGAPTPCQLSISCDTQALLRGRYALFQGDATLTIDQETSLKGERIFVDLQRNVVWSIDPLELTHKQWHGTAQSGAFNWQVGSGRFDKVLLTAKQGAIKAEMLSGGLEGTWSARDLYWTGCTAADPHWRICASRAKLKDDWLSGEDLRWQVGSLALLYLPALTVPVQNALALRCLFPKFSYDQMQGFGIRQQALFYLTQESTLKLGINWRSARGHVAHVRLLNKGGALRNGVVQGWYGVDRRGGLNRFTGQESREQHFWVQAHGMYQCAGGFPLLIGGMQYGSDKRVSERFFIAPSSRDDWWTSVAASRWQTESQSINIAMRHDLQVRNQFSPTLKTRGITQGQEERRVRRVYYVPEVTWSRLFHSSVWPLSGAIHSGADWTVTRQSDHEIVYDRQRSEYNKAVQSLHMGRVWTTLDLHSSIHGSLGLLHVNAAPYCQTRVRGYAAPAEVGGWCSGVNGTARWSLPVLKRGAFLCEPWVKGELFDGKPAFKGYQVDAKEQVDRGVVITTGMKHCWSLQDYSYSVELQQSCAISDATGLALRFHTPTGAALQPLTVMTQVRVPYGTIKTQHELCWKKQSCIAHQIEVAIDVGPVHVYADIASLDHEYALARGLLWHDSVFVTSGLKCYISPNVCWWLSGAWVTEGGSAVLQSLRREAGISYQGHCWNISAGYRDAGHIHYGRQRTQWSFYLKIGFSDLATIGTTFKQWLYE